MIAAMDPGTVPGQVVVDMATPDPSPSASPPPRVVPEASRSTPRVSITAVMACIQRHESHGDYQAENPTTTASGAYQFLDGTWRAWTDRAGVGQSYDHAADAPPAVQDYVARYGIEHGGLHAWHGSGCPGT